jgi:hypothetical protein
MPTKIQDSDRELLRYCHELRFCTVDHLVTLTGRLRQSLNVRILQLVAEKYLYRIIFRIRTRSTFTPSARKAFGI